MANAITENEIFAMERRYWQALKDNDVETAVKLTDFPCLLTGPQGVGSIEKADFESMMKSSSYQIRSFDLNRDVQVRMLSPDVAVVAYKVRSEYALNGESVTIDAADASTWIRRNGRWVCAQHSESIIGDPFGRDRKQA